MSIITDQQIEQSDFITRCELMKEIIKGVSVCMKEAKRMPCNTFWTTEEIECLRNHWGKIDINYLSRVVTAVKGVKRTTKAIIVKAERLKLGGTIENSDLILSRDIEEVLGVSRSTIRRWMDNEGLKYKKQNLYGKKTYRLINYKDLIAWLKNNQDLWDSRKIDKDYFRPEMKWLKSKLDADRKNGRKREPWGELEKQRAILMWLRGRPVEQIAKELNRPVKGTQTALYKYSKRKVG